MRQTAREYRRLPYHRLVTPHTDEDGRFYFVARIVEIPPLKIYGETREEAFLRLDEIFDDVIESMIEGGEEIPEPDVWQPGDADASASSGSKRWRPIRVRIEQGEAGERFAKLSDVGSFQKRELQTA